MYPKRGKQKVEDGLWTRYNVCLINRGHFKFDFSTLQKWNHFIQNKIRTGLQTPRVWKKKIYRKEGISYVFP